MIRLWTERLLTTHLPASFCAAAHQSWISSLQISRGHGDLRHFTANTPTSHPHQYTCTEPPNTTPGPLRPRLCQGSRGTTRHSGEPGCTRGTASPQPSRRPWGHAAATSSSPAAPPGTCTVPPGGPSPGHRASSALWL